MENKILINGSKIIEDKNVTSMNVLVIYIEIAVYNALNTHVNFHDDIHGDVHLQTLHDFAKHY